MMIRIIVHEEDGVKRRAPVLCCDVCQRQITDIQLALYKWQQDEAGDPVDETLVVLHKGACDAIHNQLHQAARWPWSEGTSLLGYLINNVQEGHSKNLWADLIKGYCPDDQLEVVEKTARMMRDPENRPLRLGDL